MKVRRRSIRRTNELIPGNAGGFNQFIFHEAITAAGLIRCYEWWRGRHSDGYKAPMTMSCASWLQLEAPHRGKEAVGLDGSRCLRPPTGGLSA